MDSNPGPANPIRRLVQWAITPPQSYGVYLVALVVVFIFSFYAGTLKPKHEPGPAPTTSAPRS